MKQPSFLLNRIGENLYGPQWQTALSRALRVSDRTMRRWANGDVKLPPTIWPELFVLLDARKDELKYLIGRVKEEVDTRGVKK